MKVLGIRYCSVSADAGSLAGFLEAAGLPLQAIEGFESSDGSFSGAIFPAGTSWIEIWQQAPGMPASTMLQIVVDDADEFAANAKANGLEPQGPIDAHGERIYLLKAPGGLEMSIQSKA